jgi:iron complex outermembrane receptor protein
MKGLLCFFILIFPLSIFANEENRLGTIRGNIITADGQAAPNVTIRIKSTDQETITDDQGNFEFRKIKPGTYTLRISLIGYFDSAIAVEVKQNDTLYLKVQLRETYNELKNVIVEASVRPDYVETKTSESLRLSLPLIEVPQNITVVTRQLLADQGLLSMTEGIRNVSGVEKNYAGVNDYSLMIRGTDAAFNVFRNGVGGYYAWNLQEDIAMLQKTEFVKGPAGFMISIAEPGGIVNTVTKQPVKERIVKVNAAFGSFNMMRLTADLGGSFSKLRSSLTALMRVYINRIGPFNSAKPRSISYVVL